MIFRKCQVVWCMPLFCLFLIVLGIPIRGIAQNADKGVGGSWVGVYWAHPDLYEVDLEITQRPGAAGAVLTDLTGALINYPTSLVKSTQPATPYKYSITGKLHPKTGYVEFRAKLLESGGGRRAIYPFYGIYDRNTDSLLGFLDTGRQGHGIDLPIYCVRASQKETLSEFIRQIAGVDEKEVERQSVEEKSEVLPERRRIAQEGNKRRADTDTYEQRVTLARNQSQVANLERQIESRKNIIRKQDKKIAKGGNYAARAKKKKAKAEAKLKKNEAELADLNATIEAAPALPPVPKADPRKHPLVRDLERILSYSDHHQRRYRAVNGFILKHESYLSRKIGPSIGELERKISKDTAVVESGEGRGANAVRNATIRIKKNEAKLQKLLGRKSTYESVLKQARQALPDMEETIKQHDERVARIQKNLIPWTSLLKKEYPDVDFPKAGNPVSLYSRNLFEDVHFAEYFQESYLKLTADKQKDYAQSINRGLEGDQRSAYLEIHFLKRPFNPALRENYALKIYLKVREGLRPWLDHTRAVLNQVAAHRDAFEEISVIEGALGAFRSSYWPSELAGIPAELADKRRNLADPVLALKVDEALGAASKLEDAVYLIKWMDHWPDVIQVASAGVIAEHGRRINRKVDQIVSPLIQSDLDELKEYKRGIEAVKQGAEWYQHFVKRYYAFTDRSYFNRAVELFVARRAEDLKASASAILKEIELCSSSHEVEEILSRMTSVPGDRASDAGRTMIAAADKRFKQLNMERLYSPYELSLMKDWKIRVPAEPSPPTSLEVGLAYLREYADVTGGVVLDHDTVKATTLLGQLLNVYMKIHLKDVTLLPWTQDNLNEVNLPGRAKAAMDGVADEELSQILAIPAGETSYWCMYSVETGIDLPKNMLGRDYSNNPLMKLLSDLYDSQQAVVFVDVVRLTEEGWRSSSARNRFIHKRDGYNKQLQEMNASKPKTQYFLFGGGKTFDQ